MTCFVSNRLELPWQELSLVSCNVNCNFLKRLGLERQLYDRRMQQSTMARVRFWPIDMDCQAELKLGVLNMKERLRILHEESELQQEVVRNLEGQMVRLRA